MGEWIVRIGEAEYRANSIEELRQWKAQGRIDDSSFIYHPDMGRWMYAREIGDLRAVPVVPPPTKSYKGCYIGCAVLFGLFTLMIVLGLMMDKAAPVLQQKAAEQERTKARTQLEAGTALEPAALLPLCRQAELATASAAIQQRCRTAFMDAANAALAKEEPGNAKQHLASAKTAGVPAEEVQALQTKIDAAEAAIREKKEAEERELKKRRDAAVAGMRKEVDELEKVTYYYDKTSPKFGNQDAFYLYIADGVGAPTLRWRVQYHSDKWLFIKSFTVYADDDRFTFGGPFSRDNAADIWEWSDRVANEDVLTMIRAVIASEKASVRYQGQDYYSDRRISANQKKALQRVLDVYEIKSALP